MERNPKYWKPGLPYMDGIKYFIIKDDGARAKSMRSDRTDVELRGFAPAEVEGITDQMGDKVTVAYPGQPPTGAWPSMWTRSPLTMSGCVKPCRWPSIAMIWPKPLPR